MDLETAVSVYAELGPRATGIRAILVILAIALPLAAVLGFLTGSRQRKRVLKSGGEIDMVVGETTLGAILALLGLLLGFTFANALAISQERKGALVSEAAAIGTAFLRADYLAEPGRSDLREKLYDYAQTRIVGSRSNAFPTVTPQAFLERTLSVQAGLWPATLKATGGETPAALQAFVAGAVNEVIDAHLVRMQSVAVPISQYTHLMLLAAALTALFLLGNRAGVVGRKLTWRTFVLSGFLFVVMAMIVDVQRANEGLIQIDQTALYATIHDLRIAIEESG